MKKLYFVCVEEKDTKLYAFVGGVPTDYDAIAWFRQNGATHAYAVSTQKEAEQIVEQWNKDYRENGTYMYDYKNIQD